MPWREKNTGLTRRILKVNFVIWRMFTSFGDKAPGLGYETLSGDKVFLLWCEITNVMFHRFKDTGWPAWIPQITVTLVRVVQPRWSGLPVIPTETIFWMTHWTCHTGDEDNRKLCRWRLSCAQVTGSHLNIAGCKWTHLRARHNERDGVSNHRYLDGLLNRLFRRRSKKLSKLRVTGDRWIPLTKDQ